VQYSLRRITDALFPAGLEANWLTCLQSITWALIVQTANRSVAPSPARPLAASPRRRVALLLP
jgi:hypothetical protein